MVTKVILSIVVAIVVGILVALVGHGLTDAGVANTGAFLNGIAVLAGILAGVWYFFAGPSPSRP